MSAVLIMERGYILQPPEGQAEVIASMVAQQAHYV